MYLGWGFLLIGLTALVGLLVGSARTSPAAAGSAQSAVAGLPPLRFTLEPTLMPERGFVRLGADVQRRSAAARTTSVPPRRRSGQRPSYTLYDKHGGASPLTPPRGPGAGSGDPLRKTAVPTARILSLARSGASVPDISRELGLGRDEVTMVINLNRLAGGRDEG